MNKALLIAAVLLCVAFVVLCVCSGVLYYAFSSVSSGYEVAGGTVYYRSFNNLNWQTERKEVPEANAATMQTLVGSGGLYGSDGTTVFFQGTSISDADPDTFKVLDWREEYSRDKNRAYWKTIAVSDSPDSFQILGANYSKDNSQVYYCAKPIEGADPASFRLTDKVTGRAEDENYEYKLGRKIER